MRRMSMQVTIDENKILTEILERDGSLHEQIKRKVEQQLIDNFVERIQIEIGLPLRELS